MSPVSQQFFRFSVVGAVGTASHFLVLVTLVELCGVNELVSSACGVIFGAIIYYRLNYCITFSSSAPHLTSAPRFL